jgi:hypothetical protein
MRYRTLLVLIALSLSLSSTACKKEPTEIKVIPFTNLSIVMDKGIYKPGDVATLTINNHTDMDLILEPCGSEPGFDFQKLINGKWNKVLTTDCMGETVEPFSTPAGSTFKHTVTIPLLSLIKGDHNGQYRLLLWLKDKKNLEFLEKEDRASDPFVIRE